MNIRLDGKTALVCGASQGIGEACAISLAQEGARIILLARDPERLQVVRQKLLSPDRHIILSADLKDLTNLETNIAKAVENYGPISILICNSGGPAGGLLFEAKGAAFLDAFNQHILANQILIQQVIPDMRAQEYGRIINIISTSVKVPIPYLGVSNTIRAAVANWAKTLSTELGAWGINVNNILPGYTDTERLKILMENTARREGKLAQQIRDDWEKSIPLRRFAQPEEIAAAVSFLASPAASYINGINLPVDGGRTPSL